MKLILAVLLLALVPPVDYNEKEDNPKPPVIYYQDDDIYVEVEEELPHEGLKKLN